MHKKVIIKRGWQNKLAGRVGNWDRECDWIADIATRVSSVGGQVADRQKPLRKRWRGPAVKRVCRLTPSRPGVISDSHNKRILQNYEEEPLMRERKKRAKENRLGYKQSIRHPYQELRKKQSHIFFPLDFYPYLFYLILLILNCFTSWHFFFLLKNVEFIYDTTKNKSKAIHGLFTGQNFSRQRRRIFYL